MNEQMKPFEDGGLQDEGGMVDKESGNEVPTGSTKKEVRDDIPAMLSEGEFVLPADVVRYHGLEKIMQLRDEAKFGLKKMEAMGQMGNSEEAALPDDTPFKGMPFGMDDLLIVEVGEKEEKEAEEKYNGGVIEAAQGAFVGQPVIPPVVQPVKTGIAGYSPSMYSMNNQIGVPNLNMTLPDPASSVINIAPTQPVYGGPVSPPAAGPIPAPAGGYQPLFYTGDQGEPIVDVPVVAEPVIEEPENFIVPTDQLPTEEEQTTDETTDEATEDVENVSVSTAQVTKDDEPGGVNKTVINKLKNAAEKTRREEYNARLNSGDGDTLLQMYAETNAVSKFGSMGAGAIAGLPGMLLTKGVAALEKNKIAKKLDAVYGAGKWQDKVQNITAKDLVGKAKEGLAPIYNKEARLNFYNEYKPKYDVSIVPSAQGATGYTKDANGVEGGNLSVREQQSFDNAVNSGNESVINHFASIARLRKKQDAFAASGFDEGIGMGMGLSTHDMEQAKLYGGSIDTAVKEGRAVKETGILGKYVVTDTSKSDSDTASSKSDRVSSSAGGTNTKSTKAGGSTSSGGTKTYKSLAEAAADGKHGQAVNIAGKGVQKVEFGDKTYDAAMKKKSDAAKTTTTKKDSGGGGVSNSAADSGSDVCCFIMLEARYGDGTMDEVVRRYRDEHMTDRNRRGYYKVAEVLVPLMRKSPTIKWLVTKTFADPLVSYGKYYYGQNKHGVIYSPIKSMWMKIFDTVGGETEFIRENGEVV